MPFFSFQGIAIHGVTAAVPEKQTNILDYAPIFGEETVRKFIKSTGISSVRRAAKNQTASDLGVAAARELLRVKAVDPASVGAMYFVTQSPDYRRPSSASVVHGRLGLPQNCAAMEINLGCSGFVYGLEAICASMACSDIRRALLVMGETASRLSNPLDKATVMLYGDAGAAVLLEKDESAGPIRVSLKSDGSRFKVIILPAGGFRDMDAPNEEFICGDGCTRSLYDIYMDGASVFSFTVSDVPAAIQEFLDHLKKTPEDYDCLALHQANGFILSQIARKFGVAREKMPVSLDRYGNTGCASIPLSLCDCYGCRTDTGIRLLMSGYGIGLSWGVAEALVNAGDIFPVITTAESYPEGKITKEMLK